MRDEWVELQRKDPALCYAYAVGAEPPLMERALDALPAQLTNRENDAMAQVLSTGEASVFAPPAESAAMLKLQEVGTRLRGQYGDDVNVLTNLTAPGVDRTKACAMIIALYSEILKLLEREAGPLVRYLAQK